MKKNLNIIALLCVFATMSLVACEKETEQNGNHQPQSEYNHETMEVSYQIDEFTFHVSLPGTESLHQLLAWLNTQIEEGHRVRVWRTDNSSMDATKDVVHFETTDKKEFEAWYCEMVEQGYAVETAYNKKTGTYQGTAIRE